MSARDIIAKRIAQEFENGMYINLGIGIPTAAANFVPDGVNVILQTENGGLMFGPKPTYQSADPDLANAGSEPVTMLPGSSAFDLSASFCLIRGGHLDATVLGALQVDQLGRIANWKIPGVKAVGMGGGMDLLAGAKKVVAAIQHTDKNGKSKIVKKCTLPLSSIRQVDLIITDKAVMEVCEGGLLVKEIVAGLTFAELKSITEANLSLAENVIEMNI